MAKKFVYCKRASSSMAERKNLKERICRKRIATFLSLMGFQDDNPDTTKSLLKRLEEIKEKEPPVVAEMGSRVRKVTFKFKLKESVVEKIHSDDHRAVESKGKKPMNGKDSIKFCKEHPRSEIDSDDHKAGDSKGKKPMNEKDSIKFSKKRPCSEIYHGVDEADQSCKTKRLKIVNNNENRREAVRELSEELRNLIRNKGGSEAGDSKGKRKMAETDTGKNNNDAVITETTEEFKNFIKNQSDDHKCKLVIKKHLFLTDLAKNNNRLSLPKNQIKPADFLTSHESRSLDKDGEFEVALLGPDLVEYKDPMLFRLWSMNNQYVLKKNWYDFAVAYGLEKDNKVEIWSFRRQSKLCFALARV